MVGPMRAFVCQVDHYGLRRFLPEDLLPAEELDRLARFASRRPTTLAWALLDEDAAEDVHKQLRAGRCREACGALLNRAARLVSLHAVAPGIAPCRLPAESGLP